MNILVYGGIRLLLLCWYGIVASVDLNRQKSRFFPRCSLWYSRQRMLSCQAVSEVYCHSVQCSILMVMDGQTAMSEEIYALSISENTFTCWNMSVPNETPKSPAWTVRNGLSHTHKPHTVINHLTTATHLFSRQLLFFVSSILNNNLLNLNPSTFCMMYWWLKTEVSKLKKYPWLKGHVSLIRLTLVSAILSRV